MMDTTTRSMSEVVQDIVGNVRQIVRSEMQLAGAEMKGEAAKARGAAIMVATGTVFVLFCLGFLLLTLFSWLSLTMSRWAAALIVAAAVGIPGWILLQVGSGRFSRIRRKPERAIGNIRENVQWLRHQTR